MLCWLGESFLQNLNRRCKSQNDFLFYSSTICCCCYKTRSGLSDNNSVYISPPVSLLHLLLSFFFILSLPFVSFSLAAYSNYICFLLCLFSLSLFHYFLSLTLSLFFVSFTPFLTHWHRQGWPHTAKYSFPTPFLFNMAGVQKVAHKSFIGANKKKVIH